MASAMADAAVNVPAVTVVAVVETARAETMMEAAVIAGHAATMP